MNIKPDISKEELSTLPVESFEGRIVVIQSLNEAEKALSYLNSFPLIGIDSETKPSFTKGRMNKVCLLQLSTEDCCFLFRLNLFDFQPALVALFENPQITKVGLSLKDDFAALHKRAKFTPNNAVELQNMVGQYGIEARSLQKIYAVLFQKKISKSQRLSNWEADILTEAQKRYAATDAWACFQIFNRLKQVELSKNQEAM